MNIDIENLLLNHKNQQGMMATLRAKNMALEKEKRLLEKENEALREVIKTLENEVIVNSNRRAEVIVLRNILGV
ncbi:MAG: hypothetical protein HFE78_07430 [Clostridiales bacterium]|nr:hypothetical protein [Clostridiales bacterium]